MISYTRSSLAEFLGIGIETLRYYERQGLIPQPRRNPNGYRIYSPSDAEAIRHLLLAKTYGFSLKEIKQATETIEPDSEEFVALVKSKVLEIEHKLRDLRTIRKRLLELLPRRKRRNA